MRKGCERDRGGKEQRRRGEAETERMIGFGPRTAALCLPNGAITWGAGVTSVGQSHTQRIRCAWESRELPSTLFLLHHVAVLSFNQSVMSQSKAPRKFSNP